MAENTPNPNQQLVIMEQMIKLFQEMQKTNNTIETIPADLKIGEKLTYEDYNSWCKMMQIAIGTSQPHHKHTCNAHRTDIRAMEIEGFNCHFVDNFQHRYRINQSLSRLYSGS